MNLLGTSNVGGRMRRIRSALMLSVLFGLAVPTVAMGQAKKAAPVKDGAGSKPADEKAPAKKPAAKKAPKADDAKK